jgi:hypothetical protein
MLGTLPTQTKRRFSLLLLEEKEYYFEDYGGFLHLPHADYHPPSIALTSATNAAPLAPFSQRHKWKGRLHICSKSLTFESDDNRNPILRFPFSHLSSIKSRRSTEAHGTTQEYIQLHCCECVEQQLNMPYNQIKFDLKSSYSEFAVSFSYVELSKVLPLILRLYDICKLSLKNDKEDALFQLIASRENGT